MGKYGDAECSICSICSFAFVIILVVGDFSSGIVYAARGEDSLASLGVQERLMFMWSWIRGKNACRQSKDAILHHLEVKLIV